MLSRRIQRDTTKTDYKPTKEAPSSDDLFNVTEAQKSHSRNRQVGMLLHHLYVNISMVLYIHSIRVLHLDFYLLLSLMNSFNKTEAVYSPCRIVPFLRLGYA